MKTIQTNIINFTTLILENFTLTNFTILKNFLFKNIDAHLFHENTNLTFSEKKKIQFTISDFDIQISLANLLISFPFIIIEKKFNLEVTKESFFLHNNIKQLREFINNFVNKSRILVSESELTLLSEEIADLITLLSDLANKTNNKFGNTINLYSISKLYNENQEVKDLINFKIPDKLQFNEIENLIEEKYKEFETILSNNNTCLKNLIKCGSAINVKQMGQTFVNIGLKPTLFGGIFDHVVNTSFLHGLRNIDDFYVNATSARKALITNHKQVKNSGYLSRKLCLMVIDQILGQVQSCDTKYTIEVDISSTEILNRLHERFTEDNKLINKFKPDEWIGRKVSIYSPITCSAKDEQGNPTICHRCFGKISALVKNHHIGIIGVLNLTSKITQQLLSSKHLLQTKSKKIEWEKNFENIFTIDRTVIGSNAEISNININKENIMEDDDGDLFTKQLTVKFENKTYEFNLPKKLFLNNFIIDEYNNTTEDFIELSNIPTNTELFHIKVANIELNSSLKKLLELITQIDHLGYGNDIEGILGEFLKQLNEAKFKIQSNYIEVILRCLIRDKNDITKFPDFGGEELVDFTVETVNSSIINNPSLAVSLSFEQIKRQLADTKTFEKSSVSRLDGLYK